MRFGHNLFFISHLKKKETILYDQKLLKSCIFCHENKSLLKVSQVRTMVTITASCVSLISPMKQEYVAT